MGGKHMDVGLLCITKITDIYQLPDLGDGKEGGREGTIPKEVGARALP